MPDRAERASIDQSYPQRSQRSGASAPYNHASAPSRKGVRFVCTGRIVPAASDPGKELPAARCTQSAERRCHHGRSGMAPKREDKCENRHQKSHRRDKAGQNMLPRNGAAWKAVVEMIDKARVQRRKNGVMRAVAEGRFVHPCCFTDRFMNAGRGG